MAHQRDRYLEKTLRKALSWIPVVGLLGMRQTGKTTILKKLGSTYFTFDDIANYRLFEKSGVSVLESEKLPVILDEAQKAPFVFDQVKTAVDARKRPGQVMMTGSVRFASKKNIRESLTGRISIFELLPLTLQECHNKPLNDFFGKLLSAKKLDSFVKSLQEKDTNINGQKVDHYFISGGLPGICLRRDQSNRSKLFDQHVDTLLGRDIQMLLRTEISLDVLREILVHICLKQGHPVNVSEIARNVRLSSPTVLSILKAFEGLFLIRSHGKSYYVEDIGLWSYFYPLKAIPDYQKILALCYAEIKSQLNYHHDALKNLTEYRTAKGSFIPFVISLKNQKTIYVTVDAEPYPSHKSLVALSWVRKKDPESIAIALHKGTSVAVLDSKVLSIPFYCLY